MKEFVSAANDVVDEENGEDVGRLDFKIDGEDMVAYRPGDGQLAVLMATTAKHSSSQEQMAGIINFFASVLDDDSHSFVVSKLLDRKDPFGIEEVTDILEWMIEEWSARPTKSPSASRSSQRSGGQKSKQRTPALT